MKLGRLAYQLKGFTDHFEVYKNACKERIFVALPNYYYNTEGLPDENGEKPIYKKENDILTYQTFDKKGRLCKEILTLNLSEYIRELGVGDAVVTIHIPEGEKLSPELISDSLKRANEVYSKYFPEFKAFVCRTWFIDPALRGEIIKDGSNMAYFADMFTVICEEDQHNHSVFEHVFKVKRQPLENLVPQNPFQQKVLNRALRGEKIYWTYGVLKKDFEF